MRCSICGSSSARVYRFSYDGMPKEVSYCRACLKKVIPELPEFSKSGLKYLAGHTEIVQDSDLKEIVPEAAPTDLIFSVAPVAVLRILFPQVKENLSADEKEVFKRRIYLLRYKLDKAIKSEDYKTAGRLKNQINAIEKRIMGK